MVIHLHMPFGGAEHFHVIAIDYIENLIQFHVREAEPVGG